MVLASEIGRFRRPSKPSAPRAGRFRKDSRYEEFLDNKLTRQPRFE